MAFDTPPQFQATLNSERSEATIEVEGHQFFVSAEQLEKAIVALGLICAKMVPAVAAAVPEDSKLLALSHFYFHPIRVGQVPVNSGVAFVARSEQFGWFHIPLSAMACQDLVRFLTGQNISAPTNAKPN